jgi:drug/metabolite transporter (DMT)-like permease
MGTLGLGPLQVMLGASLIGTVVMAPVVVLSGQYIAPVWPLPVPQLALVCASVVHVFVYSTYIWLAGRMGAVFTVQVSYMVTGFGLIWAWVLLDEAYASTIWLALSVMFVGMYLVQPRPKLEEIVVLGEI